MRKIVINGANGYVASHFIQELLDRNYLVTALVRGKSRYSAEQRMTDALNEVNNGVTVPAHLDICPYSLQEAHFSLPQKKLNEIFSGTIDYYHFAASLKYDFKSKDEIFTTNLEGVENSIRVFRQHAGKGSRFFFISTAYSCGKTDTPFLEQFYPNEEIDVFRNYYEQSKRYAENIIKRHIKENGLNAHIIRLSQVVGNNRTGVTKTDYGIFDFSRRIYNMARKYPGISLRVRIDPDSTQNLIAIDTVTGYLMRTAELPRLPVIMNFIAKKPLQNKFILESLAKLMPVTLIPDMNISRKEMNACERIISIGMSFTGSYTGTNICFDTSNLDRILEHEGAEVSPESIHNMLSYFIGKLEEKKKNNIINSAC
ncbi:MAG: SDR family oxidoreductase [Mangrovibacterium sp.]